MTVIDEVFNYLKTHHEFFKTHPVPKITPEMLAAFKQVDVKGISKGAERIMETLERAQETEKLIQEAMKGLEAKD